MLQNSRAFCSFAVKDLSIARAFYQDTLGIEVKDHPMGLLELHIVGSEPVIVYAKENHKPAIYTVLNFPVRNVEGTVDVLINSGVTFEQYPELGTDAKGISRHDKAPAIAWFKDPSGNILSIIEAEN